MIAKFAFASLQHALSKRQPRRENFLGKSDLEVFRAQLLALTTPYYLSVVRSCGRPPMPLLKAPRMYFSQQWCTFPHKLQSLL